MFSRRGITRVGLAAALLAPMLALAPAAQADVSGTWTNTGPAVGTDCPTTWSGSPTYSLQATSILKVTVAAGGQSTCSITIRGTDLSTWQISLDQGVSWTTLSGTFQGIQVNGGPFAVWYRVGTTPATLGSGVYSTNFGSRFQNPVISIAPFADKGSAELTFWLPDGRECGSISPVSVPIDSVYTLPEPGADCRTTSGAQILGWKVGWDDLVHPPGHPVLVVDSQQFTAVLQEEVLAVEFDANVAATDECFAGTTNVSPQFRTVTQEVDREDLADYRIMLDPICTPPSHYFDGWTTRPATELLTVGAKAPTEWSTTTANSVTLYAQWKPQPLLIINIEQPKAIEQLTPVQVFIGSATPAPGAARDGVVTITSSSQLSSFSSISPTMTQVMDDFFINGGVSATIVPAAGADASSLVSAIQSVAVPATLDLAVPELRDLNTLDWLTVASALVDQANRMRAIAWVDPPSAVTTLSQDPAVSGVISLAGDLQGLVDNDDAGTLLGSGVANTAGVARAASPSVLGARVTTDVNIGVWDSMGPLEPLFGVTPEVQATFQQRASMQVGGVSPIISFGNEGTIVAPNVSLNRDVRTTNQRFQDWIVQSLVAGLQQFDQFPGGAATEQAMTEEIAGFLMALWIEGALFGSSASEAFQVKCTATDEQVNDGLITCQISVRLNYPLVPYVFTIQAQVQPGLPTPGNPGISAPPPVFSQPDPSVSRPGVYIQ